MMKFFLTLSVILFTGLRIYSQPDTLNNEHLSIENLPEFTFGRGLGIMPRDSSFLINFRFRIQNRISFDADADGVSRVEARIRRLRLRFDGFVLDPRVSYALQLSFTNEDVSDFIEGAPPNLIRDAIVYFAPNMHWTLGFGQTKLPGNRERVNSSGDLQLADRSVANSVFNIDRDFGIQVIYRKEAESRFSYAFKGALTTGEGRNWISSPGTGLSYTARLEILPNGSFHRRGDFFQGDLVRENKPKIAFGFVFNFNDNALRVSGQRGDLLFSPRDIRSLMSDVIFKYRGMAFMAEYMNRYSGDPVTINPVDPNDVASIYSGQGGTIQGSYLLKNNFEFVGRYSGILAAGEISDYAVNNASYYTFGVNKYFRGHLLKLQADVTYVYEEFSPLSGDRNYLNVRFQVELGI